LLLYLGHAKLGQSKKGGVGSPKINPIFVKTSKRFPKKTSLLISYGNTYLGVQLKQIIFWTPVKQVCLNLIVEQTPFIVNFHL
jgi:hypothetical protein